jgi:hypothetical protein
MSLWEGRDCWQEDVLRRCEWSCTVSELRVFDPQRHKSTLPRASDDEPHYGAVRPTLLLASFERLDAVFRWQREFRDGLDYIARRPP